MNCLTMMGTFTTIKCYKPSVLLPICDAGILLSKIALSSWKTMYLGDRPILMAPKFGLEDGSSSNFDATLVLATMLTSQLREGNSLEPPQLATTIHGQNEHRAGSQVQHGSCMPNVSEHPSDHTKIWSDISGNYS